MKLSEYAIATSWNNAARRLLPFMLICTAMMLCCTDVDAAQHTEKDLIQTIESNAPVEQKKQACRELWKVGTAKSVPALSALLDNPKLSHMARYALEPMPCPEAGEALRKALGNTTGELKIGIVNSLGRRQDSDAVGALIPLLQKGDIELVRAVAIALGRIATGPALDALKRFRSDPDKELAPIAADASLRAVQQLLESGRLQAASRICSDLTRGEWPEHVRMAARNGLWKAQPAKAAARLQDALSGNDSTLRGLAAHFLAVSADHGTVAQVAEALPDLPPAGQARLLDALGSRRDISGRSTALEALNSDHLTVRLGAVKLLGQSDKAQDVAVLSDLLDAENQRIRQAAASSLRDFQADEANRAMLSALESATSSERASLIEILSDRKAAQAVPEMVRYLEESSDQVRIAALRGLGILGGTEQVPAVVRTLTSAADDAENQAAQKALTSLAQRAGDDALPAVLAGLESADDDAYVALLRILGVIEGDEALARVRETLSHEKQAVRDEAARVLAAWDDVSAAPELLKVAKSASEQNHCILCLRGYIRMATRSPAKKRMAMLKKAGKLSLRPQEKQLIISAWGDTPTARSLEVLTEYLQDPAVRSEAASAALKVAQKVVSRKPDAVRKAMQAVMKHAEKDTFRSQARKVLSKAQNGKQ